MCVLVCIFFHSIHFFSFFQCNFLKYYCSVCLFVLGCPSRFHARPLACADEEDAVKQTQWRHILISPECEWFSNAK